jgi:hypothetical protein
MAAVRRPPGERNRLRARRPRPAGCPDSGQPGGSPGGNNPTAPATESGIANQGGTGRVDPVKMRKLVEEWGRMPPRDQARALQEVTQGMSARHREAIENYFRNLAQGPGEQTLNKRAQFRCILRCRFSVHHLLPPE